MSDSIDHQEVSARGKSDNSLLSTAWPVSDPVENADVQPQQASFEGASSMVELTNSPSDDGRPLDSASEQNLRKLLKDVERLRKSSQPSLPEERIAADSSYVDRYLERARAHYANQDFKKSLEILHDGLKLVPGNPDILALAEEVRSASERRQAEMEESGLAERIAQCKSEAIKLFEEGRYADCIERFKVLTELEPTNTDLRDYLEVSREQTEKAQSIQVTSPVTETVESQEVQVSSSDSQMRENAEPEPSEPETVYVPVEIQNVVDIELPERHSTRLFEPSQESAPASSVAEERAQDNVTLQEYPVAVQLQQLRLKSQAEDWKQSEREQADDSDLPEDPAQIGRKKFTIACLAGVGLVIGAMIGAWLALAPGQFGRVPTDPVAPVAENQSLTDAAQPPASSAETPLEDSQSKAEKAFKQGRLQEANRFCEMILQTAPDNAFALDLKQQIRARYVRIAEQASAKQSWADASSAWHSLLRVFPDDREAARQLEVAKANLKQEEVVALASKLELEKKIEDLHKEIRLAMSSGRHLPPNSGNAFELIQKLEGVAPEDAFAREQRDEILRQLSVSAARTLQAKDTVRANALIHQMESYFPEATELKNLRDSLKAEQSRLADARSSWMQKAEAAMVAGHFVTPASNNAIAYCHELLVLDPQNAKAVALKKESIAKAAAQAQTWTQEGRYDEAKAVYSALLYLQQAENQTPLSSQQLKAEIEKLTFNAYAVVHNHALGSCSGRLRFNGYQIAYIPSSDSKDGFSANMTEVSQVESDDKLKIQLKGKSYRFQINGVKDSQEIRTRIGNIQRQLSALVASK